MQIIMGRNSVLEALRANRKIARIAMSKGIEMDSRIAEIIALAEKRNIKIEELPRNALSEMSKTEKHQGIIAFCAPLRYYTAEEILQFAHSRNESPFIIILDELEDPHNLGAIIRTAECAGAHGVIISERRAAQLTETVAKVSAGASEYLRVCRVENISKVIDFLKKRDIWIIGADMDGDKIYHNANLKGAVAFVIGSEGRGLRRLVKDKCDFLIRIPMKGKIASLNASATAAVLIYEKLRQEGQSSS